MSGILYVLSQNFVKFINVLKKAEPSTFLKIEIYLNAFRKHVIKLSKQNCGRLDPTDNEINQEE